MIEKLPLPFPFVSQRQTVRDVGLCGSILDSIRVRRGRSAVVIGLQRCRGWVQTESVRVLPKEARQGKNTGANAHGSMVTAVTIDSLRPSCRPTHPIRGLGTVGPNDLRRSSLYCSSFKLDLCRSLYDAPLGLERMRVALEAGYVTTENLSSTMFVDKQHRYPLPYVCRSKQVPFFLLHDPQKLTQNCV